MTKIKRWPKTSSHLHLGLVECFVCHQRLVPVMSFAAPLGRFWFFSFGFITGRYPWCLIRFRLYGKETIYRIFTALTEFLFIIFTIPAARHPCIQERGKVLHPELGINLSLFKESFHMAYRIFHD